MYLSVYCKGCTEKTSEIFIMAASELFLFVKILWNLVV